MTYTIRLQEKIGDEGQTKIDAKSVAELISIVSQFHFEEIEGLVEYNDLQSPSAKLTYLIEKGYVKNIEGPNWFMKIEFNLHETVSEFQESFSWNAKRHGYNKMIANRAALELAATQPVRNTGTINKGIIGRKSGLAATPRRTLEQRIARASETGNISARDIAEQAWLDFMDCAY